VSLHAYDTVGRDGQILKFMDVVPCLKLCSLLDNMLVNRYFQVFLCDKNSRWRGLTNVLPQGLGSICSYQIFLLTITVRRRLIYLEIDFEIINIYIRR
jgi:hypothetical protein